MFDLERDSAIDASIMALTALSVIAAPYHCTATLRPSGQRTKVSSPLQRHTQTFRSETGGG